MRINIKGLILLIFSSLLALPAQADPLYFNYNGRILRPDDTPLNAASVDFTVQIISTTDGCVLYEENHNLDMSTSAGVFNLKVGSGARAGSDYEDTSTLDQAFDNGLGNVTGLTCDSGTAYDAAPGDARAIRLTINEGTGVIQFSENINMASVPYARYATKLEGMGAGDFLAVDGVNNIDQTNLQNVFGGGNYTELMNLINGTSAQYADPAGANFTPTAPVDFNNQALQNLAEPTDATDAATKNYSDTYIGGAAADSASLSVLAGGADIGKVLTWNGTTWVANAPTTTDATKLPLAGGTMTGDIDMGGNDILNTGFITMSANTYLHLGTYAGDPGASFGPVHEGVTWYDTIANQLKIWDGAAAQVIGGFDIGTAAGDAMGADAVPNCLATEKLQMSAGPVYAWSCVTDATGGDFESDGSVAMTGNIRLNGNYLSGDGDSEGVFVDAAGNVGVGSSSPQANLHIRNNDTSHALRISRASDAADSAHLGFVPTVTSSLTPIWNVGLVEANSDNFHISTWNGVSANSRVVLTPSGALGIGDLAPSQRLEVSGRIVSGPAGTASGEAGTIRFEELAANGTNYVSLRAPDSLAGDVVWTLPGTDGTNGQVLQTNGSGVLSWTTPATGTGDFESDGSVAMTGQFQANSGSVSAPGITFDGDEDTGFYRPLSGVVSYSSNGSEVFGFGIGTIDIAFIGTANLEAQDNFEIEIDGNNSGSGNFDITHDSTNLLRVTDLGNVGIGQTVPSEKLDVEGSIVSGPKGTASGEGGAIIFEELAANGTNYVSLRAPDSLAGDVVWTLPASDGTSGQVLSTNGTGQLGWSSLGGGGDFESDGSVAMTGQIDAILGNQGNPGISFGTDADTGFFSPGADNVAITTGGTERVRVTSVGRVGIGVDPSSILHIEGTNPDLQINGNVDDTNISISMIGYNTGAYNHGFEMTHNDDSDNSFQLNRIQAGTPKTVLHAERDTAQLGVFNTSPIGAVHITDENNRDFYFDGHNDTFNQGPDLILRRSRGDTSALTPVMNTDKVGALMFHAYDTTSTYRGAAGIQATATADTGVNRAPTKLEFITREVGSTTTKTQMELGDDGNLNMLDHNRVRFYDTGTSEYVSLVAPSDVTADTNLTLPNGPGTNGQVLTTDGTGVMSWTTPASGGDFESDGSVAMTGQLDATLGNQGNPAISFGTDANTGFFSPGADTIAFTTGGSEQMRLTSSGELGIGGTPTTGSLVHAQGSSANALSMTIENQGTGANSYASVWVQAEGGGGNNYVELGTGGTGSGSAQQAYLATGSGVTSLSLGANLHIFGNLSGTPHLTIEPSGNLHMSSENEIRFEDGDGGEYVGFKAPNIVTGSQTWTLPPSDGTSGQVLSTDGNGVLSWQSTSAGDFLANGSVSMTGNIRLNGNYLSNDGGSEGVFVDTDGNVAIGNGAPDSKLHVFSGHTVNGVGDLILENNNWSYDMGVRFRQADNDKWHFGFSGNDTEDLHIRNNSGGYFQTWDYSTGNVGIGTSAPEEELHVEGTDTTVAVKVTNTDSSVARYPGFIVDHHKGATILGAPTFAGRTSRGTKSLPTETQTGDVLASFVGLGAYNTTPNWHTGGGMEVIAIENFNATDRGTGLRFSVTPSGTTSSENAVLITEAGDINLLTENEIRMQDAAGGQYVGFKAPTTVTSSQTYTLPAADGTSGQVLSTNGSGVLSWTASSGGSGDINNGGNSFGATMTIGTNDANELEFESNNSTTMIMDSVFLYGGGGTGAPSISMGAPGGAAQPSFAFFGDDDTGMYRSAADEISFATGATERMTLDSTGRLGIGVDPTEELHVRKDQNATTTFRVDNFTAGANADSQMILGTSSATLSITQISSSSTGTGASSPNSSLIDGFGTNGLALAGSNGVSGSISFFTDGIAEANRRMTIDNTGHTNILAEKELRLQDASGGEYVGFKAPATVTGTQTYTLPAADGTSGQVLSTNGSGVLSWTAAGGGSGDFLADGSIPMTGQFTADFGTAAAPGITFDGDEDLGIYRIAADQMAFTAAGSMKFEMNQNRFEGKDFGSAAMRSAAGVEANPAFTFVNDPDTGLFTPASNEIAFSNSGSESLRIDADGDVGIGTSAPDSILHVEPSAAPASTKGKGIKLYAQDSTGPASNTGGSILLEVGDGAGGFGSGNFSADVKSGNFFVTKGKNSAYTPGSAPDHHLFLENSWFVDSNSVFITHNVRNTANDQYFFTGAFSNSGAGTYSPSYAWVQQTGASSYAERMRIDGSGQLGIGTTSPESLVHIDGSGAGKGLCVTSDDTCGSVPAGGEISAETTLNTGADYAEYFAAESDNFQPGQLVGINPENGLARSYQSGDALLGIVSTNPGVIGNSELRGKENVVLVGLVGQLPVQSDQVYYHNGFAFANDGEPLGFALANGSVYINISSTDVQQNSEIAKLKDELSRKDQEIKNLKEKNESLESRMDRLEAMMEALSASSSRAPASVE